MTAIKTKPEWIVSATITYWDHACGDYASIDLEHLSRELTAAEAEDDARETWSEHGYSPENVTVRPA